MTQRAYYRPIPDPQGGRWPLAGGWTRFSRLELLARDAAPRIVDEAPDDVMAALTAPRAPLLGLALDRPRLMGIVNVTPDSFSDGGRHDTAPAAISHGQALSRAGADLIDIGGESTRPGAAEVGVAAEIARVVPVIEGLPGTCRSVDTRKADVARAAVAAGAGFVNDVSGLDFDPGMAAEVARSGAAICLMHAQGLPATMQDDPRYGDVLLDIYDALAARIARAVAAGIPRDRIVVDPGIGFGKTQAHNLAILRRISVYHGLGCGVLLGLSRKRFIGTIGAVAGGAGTGGTDAAVPADARDPGTLALTLAAVAQGIQIHRVHDVAGARQGLALWRAIFDEDTRTER